MYRGYLNWQILFPDYKQYLEKMGDKLSPISNKQLEVFNCLSNKKFFEIEDFIDELNKISETKIWLKIWDGKKGIGKSYQIRKKCWEIENSKDRKIMLGRMTLGELRKLKIQINTDKKGLWPFKVDKDELYSKETGEHKGTLFYVIGKGLQDFTSQEFPDYDTIIIDEYQPIKKPDEDWSPYVAMFFRFCIDVQRDKPNLSVDLYGNNNSDFNVFKMYFKTDYTSKIMLDKTAGIVVVNLRDWYVGVVPDTKIYSILKYDDEFKEFIDNNDSGEINDDIMPLQLFNKFKADYQIIYRREVYVFYNYKNLFFAVKKEKHLFGELDTYAITMQDLSLDENCELITIDNNIDIVDDIITITLEHTIAYDSPSTRDTVSFITSPFVNNYFKSDFIGG